MNIINFKKDETIDIKRNVACIGKFDGLHLGHRALINEVSKIATKKGLVTTMITFTNHLNNQLKNDYIFSDFLKTYLLFHLDIEQIIYLDFNEELRKTNYKDFEKGYLNKMNIDTLVCGFDFTYGYNALGNIKTLKESKDINFDIKIIEEVKYDNEKVSSSRIKKAVNNKDYELANKLLGLKYYE